MPLWKNTQHSFAAGQLDTHVMGRQDMDKYAHGATLLKNFLVKRQGCISKRRGTDLTADLSGLLGTKYNGTPITPDKMRLVPVTNGDDGRYVILTNGLCFVASRDGILTSDRNHIRSIPSYVAEDVDGKTVVTAARDVRASSDTPVDLVHRNGAGNYTVTRHTTLQAAFTASVNGDTVKLHGNLLLTSEQSLTASSAKAVTLDFNGYKITCHTGGRITVGTDVTLTVTSSRNGAKMVITGTGNPYGFYAASGTYTVKMGNIVFDGEIEYLLYSGSGAIVRINNVDNLTINRGTFKIANDTGGSVIWAGNSGVTINGGSFLCESETSGVTQLVYAYTDGTGRAGVTYSLTVNGGVFDSASHADGTRSDMGTGLIASKGRVNINGGRFRAYSPYFYFGGYNNTWDNTHSSYNSIGVHVARGSFAHSQIYIRPQNMDDDIIHIAETGSVMNETLPDANGFYGVKVDGEGDYRYDGFSSDSLPFRIAIPYADEDLSDLCIRQSGDTLFIAHRSYPPAKIYFDEYGYANFEELQLDNTDYLPPVVDLAEMVGNSPKETDNWPAEFTTPPAWLTNTQKTAVTTFKNACLALGTVTDAGFSGNKADGSDGSCSYACSYTCTSVSVNLLTGKKTTTVSVKSFTKSITKEETTEYTDGSPSGTSIRTITTDGTAENSASATSVIVSRTVRYVATYIKDGSESRPSAPFAVDYDMPWANNAVVNITVSKGGNHDEPDYYNIYKDNGNGYGLVGTTDMDHQSGGISGFVDTYPLFMPDNTGSVFAFSNAADYEERRGWATGDVLRKLISTGRDRFSTSPANDICLVNTASNAAGGIVFDFSKQGGARFNVIKVMLDGRIYDKATRRSYIIVSTCRVTATVTYNKLDGTTGTTAITATDAHSYAQGGISGSMYSGIYSDWIGLPYRTFTAPNGDTVYGWLYGEGDCAEEFNTHLRYVSFDFYSIFSDITGFKNVKSVKFTFDTSVYSYWTNNQQGCIHAIHFSNRGANASSGMFQDDYINPDMTVTPPDDTQDAHFSAADEYPGCVGIYEQRLVFASTRSCPSTIWMSRIADLYNFTVHESIREDDALELTLAATEFPNINHLVMGRDLMLFGDGGEWLISPVTGNALTYKTASAKLQSMIGSDRALQPLQLADETLFAERGGTSLRTINYSYTSDSYQSSDLSVIAQSLFRANAIVSMAYKQHPDSIVECVLADGRVGTLVYMKEQDVAAWSVQELGGGWKAREIVTPKCIVNGTTEMMLLVEKDGVYQLWRVRDDNDELVAEKQVVLDGLHVENSEAPQAAGESEASIPLGDGRYAVGWPIVSEFVSVRPEPEKGATAQMEIKNATESEIRVIGASSFSVKPYAIETGWREVPLPVGRDGSAVTLAEKDCKQLMTGTNNRDGRIHVKHAEPWPLTILSISNTYQVEYENDDGGGKGEGQ